MSEPIIEQATIEDLPQLTDLLVELFTQEADLEPDRVKQMRGLRMILEQPNRGRIFVLRHDGQLVGMVNMLFTISTAEGGGAVILEDLVVRQEFRHHGYGSLLMEHALDYARQKEFTRITLLTDRAEAASHAFFKKHGFVDSNMIPMRLWLNPRQTA